MQYLAGLLDETCQVEVFGSAIESEAGLRLCAELRPDAVFVDINLPGKDGVLLATQLTMLPQPPRRVFTTGNANRATDAFRLAAVDYLLKPLRTRSPAKTDFRVLAVLKLSRVRFLGRDRWRHTGAVRASAKIAKNRSEQVPPRHRVGTYLAYSSSRRSIASSRKKGVCVNYPHSLNVRSGISGSNVLAPMSANLKNNKGDRQSRNEGHTFVLVHGGWLKRYVGSAQDGSLFKGVRMNKRKRESLNNRTPSDTWLRKYGVSDVETICNRNKKKLSDKHGNSWCPSQTPQRHYFINGYSQLIRLL